MVVFVMRPISTHDTECSQYTSIDEHCAHIEVLVRQMALNPDAQVRRQQPCLEPQSPQAHYLPAHSTPYHNHTLT